MADSLQEHVADGPADCRAHREAEAGDRKVLTDREDDQHQAAEGHRHARDLTRGGPLAHGHRREHDREERLSLDEHRGQPRGQAIGDREELKQELAGEERRSDRDETRPRERRTRQHQSRDGRDQEPQRGQLGWREALEPDLRGHERQAPDDDDQQRQRDVRETQGAGPSSGWRGDSGWDRRCRRARAVSPDPERSASRAP